jgi:hypothetical protein
VHFTFGIPSANLPIALLFSNVGGEISQLAFVFVVLTLTWARQRTASHTPPRWGIPAAGLRARQRCGILVPGASLTTAET